MRLRLRLSPRPPGGGERAREPARVGSERAPRLEEPALGCAGRGDDLPRSAGDAREVVELPKTLPEGRGPEHDGERDDAAPLVQRPELERQAVPARERRAGGAELALQRRPFLPQRDASVAR